MEEITNKQYCGLLIVSLIVVILSLPFYIYGIIEKEVKEVIEWII